MKTVVGVNAVTGSACTNLRTVNTGDPVIVMSASGTILLKSTLRRLEISEVSPPPAGFNFVQTNGVCSAALNLEIPSGQGPYSIKVGSSAAQVFGQGELSRFAITILDATN